MTWLSIKGIHKSHYCELYDDRILWFIWIYLAYLAWDDWIVRWQTVNWFWSLKYPIRLCFFIGNTMDTICSFERRSYFLPKIWFSNGHTMVNKWVRQCKMYLNEDDWLLTGNKSNQFIISLLYHVIRTNSIVVWLSRDQNEYILRNCVT